MKKHHSLGRVEEKILKYLYSHPDELIQWVQKAIDHDYSTVHDAVKRLELEKEYIESVKNKETKKGKKERSYRLNTKGVAWILAYGHGDLNRIPKEYAPYDLINATRKIADLVGKSHIQKFFSKVFKLYLTLLEDSEKMTSAEAYEYMWGAMGAWCMLHSDGKQFSATKKPRSLSKQDVETLVKYFSKAKKDLGI